MAGRGQAVAQLPSPPARGRCLAATKTFLPWEDGPSGITTAARPGGLDDTHATRRGWAPDHQRHGNFLCSGGQAHRLSQPRTTNFYSNHAWMISIWTFTNNLCSQRASSHVLPLFSVHVPLGPRTESKFHSRSDEAHCDLGPARAPT